jgi:geranylgeranyl pyrophosphate synthase
MPTAPHVLSHDEYREAFNREFISLMAERTATADRLDAAVTQLVADITRLVMRGGKRLRPYLLYLSYAGSGGDLSRTSELIRLSAGLELYHTAWLIHDDIIDRDVIRHGGPNVAGSYEARFKQAGLDNAAHMALSAALLAGDYSLVLANDLILEAPFPPEQRLQAARRLQRVSLGVIGGELMDVLAPTLDLAHLTTDHLFKIYRYKTAAYSFELPMHLGAILAGADTALLPLISNFALPLGIAFQLADDLLGMFGDERRLGKSVLSDLREGKRTVLFLMGVQRAQPKDRSRLMQLAGRPAAGPAELAEVQAILESTGARSQTLKLAHHQIETSLSALDYLPYPLTITSTLRQLAGNIVSRNI